ncbi:MAG: pyruvate:ferredoxin (flavodoxin) oxidoreductase, partial [Gammaproteobacteria bacterium]
MAEQKTAIIDGNEAAAKIAHLCSDVLCIYPITPSSNMGEWADEWSSKGQTNLWGTIPEVVEMQSEAGAAGAVHGALQAGAMTTTFTASQGLLLKIPNMYKIAGELTPSVIHVSARSLAAQALSIFGDHSDVMSARQTGYAFLSSSSVQEAMDMALISYASTLEGRVPVLHFFDGFRTSHEVSKITDVSEEIVREMIDEDLIREHRNRAMNPEKPVLRGTAQNPDVYFQGRETVNKYYEAMPAIVQKAMDKFAKLTGRQYKIFEYFGAEDAEKVIIIMGSGADTTHETVEQLIASGEKVGVLKCRLFRPFDEKALLNALPKTVKKIAVLDRCKEPGSAGEPLYKDVVTAIAQDALAGEKIFTAMPVVVGGRYGLSSKEYTPAMIKGIYDELGKDQPKNDFTVGIIDDLTNTNIDYDKSYNTGVHKDTVQALFYGLGSDGTVGANKNSIKIIGEGTDQYAQGYFVYDSKKSGAGTVSHLRFGPKPMRSPYLIEDGSANFIGCHMPVFLEKIDMISKAAKDSVFLLNTQEPIDKVWDTFPKHMQEQIIEKNISVYVIDAFKVAEHTGMGNRINTIMQTCFFAISNVLPKDEAIAAIKKAVEKTYSKKGEDIVELNFKAIDETLDQLHKLDIPAAASDSFTLKDPVPANAPDFVKDVLGEIIAGRGDELPVSKMPCDGTFPTATTQYEKRNIALEIPVWEKDICIQCGKCTFVCPHAC